MTEPLGRKNYHTHFGLKHLFRLQNLSIKFHCFSASMVPARTSPRGHHRVTEIHRAEA